MAMLFHPRTSVTLLRTLFMKLLTRLVALALLCSGLIACGSGTCVEHGGPDSCSINVQGRNCSSSAPHEFFKEDATAGLLRCKMAGYKTKVGPTEEAKLKNGERVMFFK
jgi:hypothetical protein